MKTNFTTQEIDAYVMERKRLWQKILDHEETHNVALRIQPREDGVLLCAVYSKLDGTERGTLKVEDNEVVGVPSKATPITNTDFLFIPMEFAFPLLQRLKEVLTETKNAT